MRLSLLTQITFNYLRACTIYNNIKLHTCTNLHKLRTCTDFNKYRKKLLTCTIYLRAQKYKKNIKNKKIRE